MELLKKTAAAILDKEINVSISERKTISKPGFLNWLFRKKTEIEKIHVLKMRPLTLGTLIRISEYLIKIDPKLFTERTNAVDCTLQAADLHGESLAIIVAIAFKNSKEEPTAEIISLIRENVSVSELYAIFKAIVQQMDVSAFIASIISIRGVNLLEMNPANRRSHIASGEPSEDGLSTLDSPGM